MLDLEGCELVCNSVDTRLKRVHAQRQHRTIIICRQQGLCLFGAEPLYVPANQPLGVGCMHGQIQYLVLLTVGIANRLYVAKNVPQHTIDDTCMPVSLDALYDLNRLVDRSRCRNLGQEHHLVERNT